MVRLWSIWSSIPRARLLPSSGGGPFNAARAIGRLGSDVAFLGRTSHDRFGSLLHRELLADGVGDRLVQFTDLPTTLASAELDEHGAASYHFYLAETAAPNLQPCRSHRTSASCTSALWAWCSSRWHRRSRR